jgi:iron(III) transport system ATP-binding protein
MLVLQNIEKSFDSFSLKSINFTIEEGEIIALVGESGSGKSTLLRIIAGLEQIEFGDILMEGQSWKGVSTNERSIGFVFQDYALFPHLNVRDNILFAFKNKSHEVLNDLLETVGLIGYEERMMHQLSGGEQQRVALARSLAIQPRIMLLDEPFSNLDTLLKHSVRKEIKAILESNQQTSIMVTHDLEDAYEIADRIAVLKNGELIQIDTPANLYNKPVNDYVAGLTGHYSYFENQRLRPEQIVIDASGSYQGVLIKKTFNGADYEIELKCNKAVLIANLSIDSDKNVGDYLNFSFNKR